MILYVVVVDDDDYVDSDDVQQEVLDQNVVIDELEQIDLMQSLLKYFVQQDLILLELLNDIDIVVAVVFLFDVLSRNYSVVHLTYSNTRQTEARGFYQPRQQCGFCV